MSVSVREIRDFKLEVKVFPSNFSEIQFNTQVEDIPYEIGYSMRVTVKVSYYHLRFFSYILLINLYKAIDEKGSQCKTSIVQANQTLYGYNG